MSSIRIVIAGAAGRMGQALIHAVSESEGLALVGAFEAQGRPEIGKDSGTLAGIGENAIPVRDDPLALIANADVLMDFTRPSVSVELAALCAQARICHVLGTTGLAEDDETKIRAAARHAVIVKSGNMSMGVALLAALVKKAAKALPDFDVEIVEMHHRQKIDAPSGTALLLGRAAAEGRGIALEKNSIRGRDGQTGARPQGAVGFVSLRGGTVIGDHDVIFAGPGERIVLSHIAEDRTIFARGAIAAARWGHGKKPGLYSMADVLGVSD
jgi:4-hydroxy-tetrahydrodipicolinate reductase